MKRFAAITLSAALALVARDSFAERAGNPPAFAYPFDINDYEHRISAGYDLNPTSDARADFTGWTSDETASSTGQAYDTHNGIDFASVIGTAVHATASGTVHALRESVPNNDTSDIGNYLQIDHTVGGRDWRTQFFHLAQNGVVPSSVGSSVTKGNTVCYSNNTGNTTGPHLHYSIAPLPGNFTNCPFYKAWWEEDEFYTAINRLCMVYVAVDNGTVNVYQGDATTYNVITTIPAGTKLVATARNGDFWRVFIPQPPARTLESRTPTGALASFYSETGTWADSPNKTTVQDGVNETNRVVPNGLGSRVVDFEDVSDLGQTATVNFPITMKGNYDLYVSWPDDANAQNVTYKVTDSDGRRDVTVDQKGGNFIDGGDGTKENPYIIGTSHYVANHTTIGAQSEWDVYTPCAADKAEAGPENVYEFILTQSGAVTVSLDAAGNGTKDVDVHLLSALDATTCLYRDDESFTTGQLAAGTYYISVDTFGTDDSLAGAYELTVDFANEPAPNQWYYLGTYWLDKYQDPLIVELDTSTVTGKVFPGSPGRIYSDSFKLSSKLYRRTGWIPYGQSRRIDTNSEPTGCVVVNDDATDGYSRNINAYASIRVYDEPSDTAISNIVGKIVTGQRFVCDGRAPAVDRDWYRIILTNGTAMTKGWVKGDHLLGYHTADLPTIEDPGPTPSPSPSPTFSPTITPSPSPTPDSQTNREGWTLY